VRHRNDYAVIVLADIRYESDAFQRKLPSWIAQSTIRCHNFVDAFNVIVKFFAASDKKEYQRILEEQREKFSSETLATADKNSFKK